MGKRNQQQKPNRVAAKDAAILFGSGRVPFKEKRNQAEMKKCSRSGYNLLHHRLPRRLRQQRESVRLRLPALGRERTARGENPYHVPRAMSSNAPQARADHTIVNECSSSPRSQYRLLNSPCQRTQRDGARYRSGSDAHHPSGLGLPRRPLASKVGGDEDQDEATTQSSTGRFNTTAVV
jgi:hypothetical protein